MPYDLIMDEAPNVAPGRILVQLGPTLPAYVQELEAAKCTRPLIIRSINQLFGLLYRDWDWDEVERMAYRFNQALLDSPLDGFVLYVDFASDLLGSIQSQRLYNLFTHFEYEVQELLPSRGCILLKHRYVEDE